MRIAIAETGHGAHFLQYYLHPFFGHLPVERHISSTGFYNTEYHCMQLQAAAVPYAYRLPVGDALCRYKCSYIIRPFIELAIADGRISKNECCFIGMLPGSV